MNAIGGYFSLELHRNDGFPHSDGLLLNTGHNALEYIIKVLGDVKLLYIPYYTCDVILVPLEKLKIAYTFYNINERFELSKPIKLTNGEYILYTNYFGLKNDYCKTLVTRYGQNIIIDNAQAYFTEPIDCAGTIYSPRKFVGVPDGGIAYCTKQNISLLKETDISYNRCSHLLKRLDIGASGGYEDFHKNDEGLAMQPMKRMSPLTKSLLSCINYKEVKQ